MYCFYYANKLKYLKNSICKYEFLCDPRVVVICDAELYEDDTKIERGEGGETKADQAWTVFTSPV